MDGIPMLTMELQEEKHNVMPWWMGYLLINPLRSLREHPETVLSPYVQSGMTVLDLGCAMGFYTLPMARLVGERGHVVAVDIQQKMLTQLKKRAYNEGLFDTIDTRLAWADSLNLGDLPGQIDFALACAVMHEIPDRLEALKQVYMALAEGGKLLILEPPAHVSLENFSETYACALEAGFRPLDRPKIAGQNKRSVLLVKGRRAENQAA